MIIINQFDDLILCKNIYINKTRGELIKKGRLCFYLFTFYRVLLGFFRPFGFFRLLLRLDSAISDAMLIK